MPINGYNLAFEQATEERAEIRVKIEQLMVRGGMLDKLMECLEPFVSVPAPIEEAHVAASEAPAAEAAAPAQQEEHQEHQEQCEHQEA